MASGGGQGYSSYNQSSGYYTSTGSNGGYSGGDGYHDSQYGSYSGGGGSGKANQYGGWSSREGNQYGGWSNRAGGSRQSGGYSSGDAGYPGGDYSVDNPYGFSDRSSGKSRGASAGYSGDAAYPGGDYSVDNPYGFSDRSSGKSRGGQKRKYGDDSGSWSGNDWSQGGNSASWSQPSGGNDYYGAYSDSYGRDYDQSGYDYDMEGDYGYSTSNTQPYRGRESYPINPNNPFRKRGAGSNTYHRVWRKGMPLWKNASERQAFKRKFNKKFDAFDDVRKEVEKDKVKERSDAMPSKKKTVRAARVKNFKKVIALKKKYRSVKQNKNLTFNEQLVLIFLKRIAYEMCEGEDMMVHCLNFSKLASRHPNALKIFANEAKVQMDRKYDLAVEGNIEKRKAYLGEARDEIVAGFKKVYKHRSEPDDIATKTALIDEYIGIVSGETYNPDLHIPTDDDLVLNKDHSRKEEDFVNDIKYEFIFYCYEAFRLKVDEQKRRTKNLVRRLKFHWDNKIIPFLVVENVRTKGFVYSLPEPLSKYIFPQSPVHQERNISLLNSVLEHCAKNEETVVTPISKYIAPGTDYSTEVYRDFADCILLFDKFATYGRFRMVKYTPHILLSTEMKEKLFQELVDRVYGEALEILVKNEKMETRQFEDMTAEPEELQREVEREAEKKLEMEKKEAERKAQDEAKEEVKEMNEGEANKDVKNVTSDVKDE